MKELRFISDIFLDKLEQVYKEYFLAAATVCKLFEHLKICYKKYRSIEA